MKNKILSILSVLFVLSLPLLAQESPKITVPDEIIGNTGDFIYVKAETEGKIVEWYSLNKDLKILPTENLKDGKTAIVTSCRPGIYQIIGWTAKGDMPSKAVICTINITGSQPLPPIPPNPPIPPPVPPIPVSQKLWIVIIEETAQATINRAKFYTDVPLLDRLKSKGHSIRVLEKDTINKSGQVPPNVATYLKRAEGRQLPYAIFTNQQGQLVHESSISGLPAEFLALIISKGG